jgi:WD40 repeat protein/serine/threonine protein kinase
MESTLEVQAAPTEKAGDRIGRYKLREKIGEGGCGVVYVAEQEEPVRRRVALKVIKLGMDTRSVVARFEAERQALALMDHPNIAKVFDAGSTELGRPFFVMELVRGVRITQYCDQNKLSTRERLDLFIKVCQAVQHAHQKGIIHRDLKPSNILVTLHDGTPVPKVIDFGIAKATEGRLTDLTVYTELYQFIGTPAYMSPEQAEMSGLDIDTRSDVYSLGVLLYELLTGCTPFDAQELVAGGLEAMRRTIREMDPVRPSTRLNTMSPEERTTTAQRRGMDAPTLVHLLRGDLDWIVMKCLEKDRVRRYETANGLGADLQRFINNEPVAARPPSTSYRFRKFVRRNRAIVAAATSVALVLALGTCVSTWQAIRATRAERAQSKLRGEAQDAQIIASAEAKKAKEAVESEKRERTAREKDLYIADMNLAQQAWEQNNIEKVRQLLKATADFPNRGFEWYYWQRQIHLDLRTFRGHTSSVNSVAFSPDGERLATGSADKIVKIWDINTGKELLSLAGHKGPINSLAFAPDGQRMLTGSDDHSARIWDVVTGKTLFQVEHATHVICVAFSPDGTRFITGSGFVWDPSAEHTAKIWNAKDGAELLTLNGHAHQIDCVAFSPDGLKIVTGCYDNTVKIWDARTSKELITLNGHAGPITSAAFSSDSRRVVTGSLDHNAIVWDAESGNKLLTLKGHEVSSVAFSPDGNRILTSSYDQTAQVSDALEAKTLLTLKGHSSPIHIAVFSPDGRRIATGSGVGPSSNRDHTAKLWDATLSKESVVITGPSNRIHGAAFAPDGLRVATANHDGTIGVYDAQNGRELLRFSGLNHKVRSVAYSPDGRWIFSGSDEHAAKFWDAVTGRELFKLPVEGGQVTVVALSPDGKSFFTATEDFKAEVWEIATRKRICTLQGHTEEVWSAQFAPDNQRIVTASVDKTAKVWDALTGKLIFTLNHLDPIVQAVFSRDGRRIATASVDRTAKIWSAVTGELELSLEGNREQIWGVDFSPDGIRILTGSRDGTLKLWDTATGQELLALKAHTDGVWCSFSKNGQSILSASWDSTARIFQAAQEQQVVSWNEGDRAAEEGLKAFQRQQAAAAQELDVLHARDTGAIKQWLVLAPIRIQSATITSAIEQEQVPQESHLRPREGDHFRSEQKDLAWKVLEQQDYLIDFNHFLGRTTEFSVAYAVCYLQSDLDHTNLLMRVLTDDFGKIYLNQREIYKTTKLTDSDPDRDRVENVELREGLNVLVFKVVNGFGQWKGSVWLTERDGRPVKGIRVTLAPP